jgi:hypothetical protein
MIGIGISPMLVGVLGGDAGAALGPGLRLEDLTDVTITNPQDGQELVYRSGIWVNE